MSFVSYAQNYEDVMLARAFAGLREGFYVDVGAQDPRFDSVTKAFYDMGWRGINLEPVEHWHQRLVQARPRDINLCLAAGDHRGTLTFHETDESGLSTASEEFARRHREQGHALRTRQVPVDTLDAILREHDVAEVHFLKVDVEGAEAEVLRGLDLGRLRPWIILVEATEPNSRVSNHAQWESLVTGHDYRMAYYDGLNRYYLAREHEELAPAFDAPPNIFDAFIRREQLDLGDMLQARIDEISTQLGKVDALAQARAARIDELDAHAASLDSLARARAARIDELDARVASLDERVASLDQLASRRLVELQQLQSRLDARTAEAEGLREELAAEIERSDRLSERLSHELADARAEQHAAFGELGRALAAHEATLAELARTQLDFQRIIASRSWRLTAPLRHAMGWAGRARDSLAGMLRVLARWRWARVLAALALRPFPGVAGRVKQALYGVPAADPEAMVGGDTSSPHEGLPLTADAQAILSRHPVRTGGRTRPGVG